MKKKIIKMRRSQESRPVQHDLLDIFTPAVTTPPVASESRQQRFRRCMEQIARGVEAFFDIAEPLREIKRDKLYLVAIDADGNPLYPTFGHFLKTRLGMSGSVFCKMCKARDTYMRIKERYGDDTDARLGDLKSMSGLYELSQVPQERLPEAIDAITADAGQTSPTADDVTRWREANVLPEEAGRRLGRPRKTVSIPSTPSLFDDAEDDAEDDEEEPQSAEDEDDELDEEDKPDPDEQLYNQLMDLLGNYALVSYVAQEERRFEAVSERFNSFYDNVQEAMPEQHSEEETYED